MIKKKKENYKDSNTLSFVSLKIMFLIKFNQKDRRKEEVQLAMGVCLL